MTDEAGNVMLDTLEYYLQTKQSESNQRFFNYPNPFSPLSGEITTFMYNIIDDYSKGD